MKIRKVSAELLEPAKKTSQRPLSARDRRRRALEASLEAGIRRADREHQAALRIDLQEGDKAATIGLVLLRADGRQLVAVNLFSREGAPRQNRHLRARPRAWCRNVPTPRQTARRSQKVLGGRSTNSLTILAPDRPSKDDVMHEVVLLVQVRMSRTYP